MKPGAATRLTLRNDAGQIRRYVVAGDAAGIKPYEVVGLEGASWLVVKVEPTTILWTREQKREARK